MQDLIDSIKNSRIISIGYKSGLDVYLDSFISILDHVSIFPNIIDEGLYTSDQKKEFHGSLRDYTGEKLLILYPSYQTVDGTYHIDNIVSFQSCVVMRFGATGIDVLKNRLGVCKKYQYSDLRDFKIELILK